MEFCDECGSLMVAEGELWVCQSCGHEQPKDPEKAAAYVSTQDQEASEIIETEKGDSQLPETDALCPNCGNKRAHWYLQQTRSADESETRFLICTECEYKWREDDN